jgi:hypothetical protein
MARDPGQGDKHHWNEGVYQFPTTDKNKLS